MIRVLVVDDSAIVRQVLTQVINIQADMEVVATAPDPFVARDKLLRLNPDVMTLDIEMPRMDGITFLRKVMRYRPVATIVLSSLTPKGGDMAMDALDAGAVDVLCKPGEAYTVGEMAPLLCEQIRVATEITLPSLPVLPAKKSVTRFAGASVTALKQTTRRIVALGASTGGTRAIEALFLDLPADIPGMVVVQHMPEKFTASFAKRLNGLCPFEVREAKDGDSVLTGQVLIAPGNYHMRLWRSGTDYRVSLDQENRVHHQRPAVDPLFESVAKYAGSNALCILLTGMGCDGAAGMLDMKNAGAQTIAQDEASSVVWGMPGAAVKMGAAAQVLALQKIAGQILEFGKCDQVRRI